MNNYHVRVTVNNSAGNELVKIFNFTTVEDMEFPDMYRILFDLVKKGYNLKIDKRHRKSYKNPPISFEKLCIAIRDWRFYETKIKSECETKYSWNYVLGLDFPCEVYLKWFNSEWGGTFFEIAFEEKSLVEASFDSIKAVFEKHGLDLCKSKTEGLWYSHSFLELTDLHDHILIRKKTTTYEWVSKTQKIEL